MQKKEIKKCWTDAAVGAEAEAAGLYSHTPED